MGRLGQQAVFLTIEKACHLAGAMLLLVAVARVLGDDALGEYAYVIASTAIFVPILDVGLNTRVIRAAAAGEVQSALQNAVGFKVRFGAVAVCVMVLCAWVSGKSEDVIWAVGLVGISTWAMSLGDVFSAVFKGLHKAHYSAMLVGGTYVVLTLWGIGVMLAGGGLVAIAVAYVVCRVGFFLVAWGLFYRLDVCGVWGAFRWQTIYDSMRFMPAVFFVGVLLNANFITADVFGQGEDSGFFAIGYRVGAALFALMAASMEGILPALVGEEGNGERFRSLFLRCSGSLLGAGIFGVVAVQFLGYWAVLWIFGAEYLGAVGAVKTLGWVLPALLVCAAAHTGLLALGFTREALFWMVGLVGSGTIVGAMGFLLGGAMGTAWAPTVTGGIFACALLGRVWYLLQRV